MPEETKPKESEKTSASKGKMVPESDLIAVKKTSLAREKDLKEDLAKAQKEVVELTSQVKMLKLNLEDEGDVAEVRQYLINEAKSLDDRKVELDKEKVSLDGERREAEVKALAEKHKVDLEKIKDADDPEKEALRIVNERLAGGEGGDFFETKTPGQIKKEPKHMTDDEFEAHVKAQEEEALSKK